MHGRTIHATLFTCAVLGTVLGLTLGAAGRGESYEVRTSVACENAAWPAIPTNCLDGSTTRDVRLVGAFADPGQLVALVQATMKPLADVNSGKADLLERPKPHDASYVTVETRADGVSMLRRVKIAPVH